MSAEDMDDDYTKTNTKLINNCHCHHCKENAESDDVLGAIMDL